MLKILLPLLMLMSFSAFAQDTNQSCRQVYNDGYEKLRTLVVDFNEGYLGKVGFASQVVALDTEIAAVRGVCLVVEEPRNKECVNAYKKRYKALRKEVKVSSVVLGGQTEVKEDILESISNEFSNIYYRLKCGDL
ncbi:MAG: hypothetical protein EP326_12755 [Deltaproteobacteria bacterium]|nr:MAG: hypothetical protein EP326_12755 [Deltaproteobacteria bacterium]